jgi:N-acetylglucosaminyldiphosphoundecaprenol N-acetyl-beta-D-mannosaminyltransferase
MTAVADLAGIARPAAAAADPAVEIYGVPLHPLTMAETLDRVEQLVADGGPHQHVVLNAAKVVQVNDDPALREIVRGCALVNADGQAVVWGARLLGVDVPERVTGVDLMDSLLDRAAERGWSVYFLGATEDVVRRVVEVQQTQRPTLQIAGFRNGYWTADEEAAVVAAVAAAQPTLLFVAMPTPRKEFFLAEHLDALNVPFAMGVGGSFDIVAGVTQRAPLWMQRAGLEWAYRLVQEPRRMFRRYLVGNIRFMLITLAEKMR